jgi:hypothetical protein
MAHLLLEAGEDGLKESVPYQINDGLQGAGSFAALHAGARHRFE